MINKLHRLSALLIGTFVLLHLINHLFIFAGVQRHIDLMESFRLVYRNPVVEPILLACLLFQVASGIYFVWRRRGQRSELLDKLQVASGLYLAYFLLMHVGAVLFGRAVLQVDTNLYFGIAGFHSPPFHFYFIPYYFLAVVAIFVHLACAFNWLSRNSVASLLRVQLSYSIVALGVVISTLLILSFNGVFGPIAIPTEYSAFYE